MWSAAIFSLFDSLCKVATPGPYPILAHMLETTIEAVQMSLLPQAMTRLIQFQSLANPRSRVNYVRICGHLHRALMRACKSGSSCSHLISAACTSHGTLLASMPAQTTSSSTQPPEAIWSPSSGHCCLISCRFWGQVGHPSQLAQLGLPLPQPEAQMSFTLSATFPALKHSALLLACWCNSSKSTLHAC